MNTNKTVASCIEDIKSTLQPLYTDALLVEQYAWWILESITQKTQAHLIVQDTLLLDDNQQTTLASWLDKMVNEHMPLQYLLGSVPFGNLDIIVEPPLLIPRPETEEWAIDLAKTLHPFDHHNLTILDLCSGSGCIALTLAQRLPHAQIYAVDISEQAVALGRKNARHNNIHNVTFIHSDLFDTLETSQLFDIIVGNPPYLSFDELQEVDNSVSTWEDPQALVAADDGYALLEQIIEQAPDYIKPNAILEQHSIPQLVLEIGYKQGKRTNDFAKTAGYINVTIHKDLEGKNRTISGRIGHVITPFMAE